VHGASVLKVTVVVVGTESTSNSLLSLAKYTAVTVPPPTRLPAVAVVLVETLYAVGDTISKIVSGQTPVQIINVDIQHEFLAKTNPEFQQEYNKPRVLYLLPGIDLLKQTLERFKTRCPNFSVGGYGAKLEQLDTDIVIASSAMIYSRIKNEIKTTRSLDKNKI
jgi:hypothetical protein